MIALATSILSLFGAAPPAIARPLEPVDVLEDKFAGFRQLPAFGTTALYAVLVTAAFAFALSLLASKRPRFLPPARSAAFATCALVVFNLLLLAYAFVTHDFRIRYVARYSDRSMSTGYLLTALWGGQDGSLLWWLFLLSANTTACLLWIKGKYKELEPYVIATLMTVMMFFVVIMAFSANPFSESISGARVDGEGLNPLLQNFYMIIHPPSLYTGFVGCTVPFAFGIAALASGRLGEEWLVAVRKWMLFAWVFLAIGNTLGMLWAYEELGWGGHWAWDPVENAAFMPWLTASAFVHSIMIQERRQMLKVWNVVLLSMTFFMTIFGTFLTRSGMIASVHAFAQSNIGIYFTYFLSTIACVVGALIVYRLPELKNQTDAKSIGEYRAAVGPMIVKGLVLMLLGAIAIRWQTEKLVWMVLLAFVFVEALVGFGLAQMDRAFRGRDWWPTVQQDLLLTVVFIVGLPLLLVTVIVYAITMAFTRERGAAPSKAARAQAGRIDSIFSREAAFVANNWVLLAMQMFVLGATTFPLISEAVSGEKVTVGPAFFNRWMVPLGLILFALMGVGPLLGWRKTSDASLRKAFRAPLIAIGATIFLHFTLGRFLGFPAMVESDPIYPGILGTILAKINGVVPVVATSLAVFNLTVIAQEYTRGLRARMRANPDEGFFVGLLELVARARRRYGGYIVHAGIVAMFLGFTGGAYKVDQEYSLHQGEQVEYQGYTIQYVGPRRVATDPAKMEIYIDLHVWKGKKDLGVMSPARFIYRRQNMPTSEVDIKKGLKEDLYIAPGSVNPESKIATIHVYVNPLEMWIWLGAMILILGAAVATWPDATLGEVGVGAYLRTAGATVSSLVLGLLLALTPARARADTPGTSSLHAGNVEMKTPEERQLYSKLLCMCGGCDRLPLSACVCDWAVNARKELAERLAAGDSIEAITDDWVKKHGTASLNVPPSRGFLRSIWLVPSVLILVGGAGAIVLVRRWSKKHDDDDPPPPPGKPFPDAKNAKDDYDRKLDDELRDLDG